MPNSSLLLVSYLLQLSKLMKSLQLRNIFAVILLPLCGIWLAIDTPLRKETAVWAITYYFLSGIGITAGKQAGYLYSQLYTNLIQAIIDYGPIDRSEQESS